MDAQTKLSINVPLVSINGPNKLDNLPLIVDETLEALCNIMDKMESCDISIWHNQFTIVSADIGWNQELGKIQQVDEARQAEFRTSLIFLRHPAFKLEMAVKNELRDNSTSSVEVVLRNLL